MSDTTAGIPTAGRTLSTPTTIIRLNTDLDLIYLCRQTGDMAGIPVRLCRGRDLIYCHSAIPLPKDPLSLYLDQLLAIKKEVGYFITPTFDYYGILNTGDLHIIIGPARQADQTRQELKKLAFDLEVPAEETEPFLSAMQSFIHLPLDSMLRILCSINYVVNGSRVELSDLELLDSEQSRIRTESRKDLEAEISGGKRDRDETAAKDIQKTFFVEQQLMDFVLRGDPEGYENWIRNAPTFRPGILSTSLLRQTQDSMIMSATIYSRAAIRGGMESVEALTLCNSYIQKIERMTSVDQLTNLGYRMLLDYCRKVAEARSSCTGQTELVRQVTAYIRRHMSENIKTDDLAEALYLSRSRLSTRFKQEAGINLNEYITTMKISEAKHLLRYTDKSPLLIASYLGFSSQSYFCSVFKKETGKSPLEFRAG